MAAHRSIRPREATHSLQRSTPTIATPLWVRASRSAGSAPASSPRRGVRRHSS
jgi:hypothetical protein